MKAFLAAVAAVAISAPVSALACGGEKATTAIQKIDSKRVAELQKSAAVHVYDANTEKTRAEHGIVPGAKLLSSASLYDPEKELTPAKDAALVFYCANQRCKASHAAAERAVKAGYTNVSILPEGIVGWKAAGQSTAKPST